MSLHPRDPSVTASFFLSALVVAVVAVVLHPGPDHPPEPKPDAPLSVAETAEIIQEPGPEQVAPPDRPAIQAARDVHTEAPVIRTVSRPIAPPRTLQAEPVPPALTKAGPVPPALTKAEPRHLVPRQDRAPVVRPGDFLHAEGGETLAEVARRVYGSTDPTRALWMANRDRVASPDVPLGSGMLLRAP